MLEAVAPILKDVFSSADVIIYYGADGNLSPFDITGIGQESNRVVDAMAEFSEARAVPDRCSGFKTYGIEEAAEFIGCEIKSIERGSSAAARTAFKAHAWASSRISSEPDPVRRYREDTWERNYEQLLVTEFDGKYFERMDRETILGKGREYAEEQAAVYAYSYVAGCAVAHCVFEECITRLVAEHRDDEIADIDCEKFGKEHGIEDAYDEFSEKQLNQLKIDDDKEFLRECRPLFCPKCETRMEQKTLEVQFGSSANAMTARSVGCHVCPICGRITFDDDDMRAARGYKETVKLAIDGVAGGSITDYGRRNAENYGARWERYYREGYLERYFARLDEVLAEAAERGDVAYIGNRWAHSQAKAEAEGWVRRKTERWCKIAEAIERYASQGRTDEFEKALEEGRADAILSELGLDGAYAYY